MRLFWHQQDLRVRDNRGLSAAARADTVVPVYVVDDDVLSTVGSRKRAFLTATVRELRREYRRLGSDLVVREGPAAEVLPGLAETFDVTGVDWNEYYDPARLHRQDRVQSACAQGGIETRSWTDSVLVDPAALDESYSNHGAFRDDWQAVPKREPYPAPGSKSLADVFDETPVPVVETDIPLPAAGYEAARERLDEFLADGIDTYRETRDDLSLAVDPTANAVSRLSPYLAAGAIGIREVWAETTAALDEADDDARPNLEKYRDELSWREGYYHLLFYNPDLLSTNYRTFPNPIAWRDDDEAFEAWKAGRTGYPLVDAGMRQLEREGYVHNRPRQVVASFLTKHLLIDWRRGERHFADRLVDYDAANDAGNWQWVASTGTDTVDVRIFDPVSQLERYDPAAEFVTEYVPELRGVPAEKVAAWPTLSPGERDALAPGYCHPIVDRDEAYERAERVFERALGER
ncbi:cryptochrome/photolyase family protein [Haloarchaeobius sp. TZWWS8]|uniref:cryptochrome/photolyase family protein n=1 Tax=Haloarchaeobius sp. TZWWS8 TaxID=3446121 RepID=UPI003EBBE797